MMSNNRDCFSSHRDIRFCLAAFTALLFVLVFLSTGCTKKSNGQEIWIYTSLYKDTIADITPRLEKAFPAAKFHFFQAGSEEVAAKVNGEILSGDIKADVLISSDRYWYEEMATNGKLLAYLPRQAENVPENMRHPQGFYTTLSHPVMVIVYNKELVKDPPRSFRELTDPKWKGKFSSGSPLASGTNFSTVSVLTKKYGWEYVQKLRANEAIAEGGNSAVIGRVQSGERPVGAVLLENILRFQGKDDRLGVVYPDDGAILISNVMAIVNKQSNRDLAKGFADWAMGREGQEAMIRSFMYSPVSTYSPPIGAPAFSDIVSKAFPLTPDFLAEVMRDREKMKEQYAQIMFQ